MPSSQGDSCARPGALPALAGDLNSTFSRPLDLSGGVTLGLSASSLNLLGRGVKAFFTGVALPSRCCTDTSGCCCLGLAAASALLTGAAGMLDAGAVASCEPRWIGSPTELCPERCLPPPEGLPAQIHPPDSNTQQLWIKLSLTQSITTHSRPCTRAWVAADTQNSLLGVNWVGRKSGYLCWT